MPSANDPKSYYASKKIRTAVSKLQKYFGVKSAEDQARALFGPQTETGGSTAPVDALSALIMDLLIEGVPGARIVEQLDKFFKSDDIKDQATTLIKKVQASLSIYVDGKTSAFGIYDCEKIAPAEMNLQRSKNETSPETQESDEVDPPMLTIINVMDPTLAPSDRNTGAIDLFLNSMPTHELMQCSPFLDIQLMIGSRALDDQNRLFGLTLPRFIMGADTVAKGSPTEQMVTGDSQTAEVQTSSGPQKKQVTRSGMEMFTSPQTLIPLNTGMTSEGSNSLLRPTPILDRFRPLLSIRSFDVNVIPQNGPLSYKDATLELTLHDRSRLHEVSELVRPDNYGTTEIMIEYGWSHPNSAGNNAFADIINAMRVKEKYGVMNSSFTFNQNGSVNITLRLFLKGPQECIDTDINEHGSVRSKAKVIQQIIDEVSKLIEKKNKILANKKSGRKEVKPSRVIDGALNFDNLIFLGAKSLKKVRTVRQNDARRVTANSKDAKKLQVALSKLANMASDYQVTAARMMEAKLKLLEPTEKSKGKFDDADPFDPGNEAVILRESVKRKSAKRAGRPITPKKKKKLLKDKQNAYVSFGKLMSVFVGRPLLKNFSEVQLIFYPLNSRSRCTYPHKGENSRPMTVAEFFVRKDLVAADLSRLIKTERTASVSLNNFMQRMISEHIEFVGSEPYGLGLTEVESALLRNPGKASSEDAKKKWRKPKANESASARRSRKRHNSKLLAGRNLAAAEKKLSNLNTFVMPKIRIMFECLPMAPTEPGQTDQDTSQGTLLKVHFFDEMAGKKEVIEQLLDSSQDQSMVNIQRQIADSPKSLRGEASFNDQITKLSGDDARKQYGIQIKKVDHPGGTRDEFEVVGGYQGLRKYILQNFSSLVYGSSATGIKNAQFSSMNDSKLNTVHMRRAGRSPNRTVAGQDPGGLPLRVQPTTLSMTTIGCPLLQFGQSFFVDFGTATTADDVYSITKLTHRIGPGKFESTLSCVPRQVYGRFQGLMQVIETAQEKLEKAEGESTKS